MKLAFKGKTKRLQDPSVPSKKKEKFLALLGSGKKENTKQIKKYLQQYPILINERHLGSRDTVFHLAVFFGEKEFVEELCSILEFKELGYLQNEQQKTVIHYAVKKNDNDLLLYLIEQFPLMVDKKDANGNTALHQAIMEEKGELISSLVKNGRANIFKENEAKMSPLMLCYENEELINKLMPNFSINWKKNNREILHVQYVILKNFPTLFSEEKYETESEKNQLIRESELFDRILEKNGLTIGDSQGRAHFSLELKEKEELIIWKMCSYFDQRTYFQTIALSQMMPIHQILSNISSVLDKCNSQQVLIANYIVKTLILIPELIKKEEGKFESALSEFFEKNKNIKKIKSRYYEDRLKKMVYLIKKSEFEKEEGGIRKEEGNIEKEEKSLGKEEECIEIVEAFFSEIRIEEQFDVLINQGFEKNFVNRKELVDKVANEIRELSKLFYLEAKASDFIEKESNAFLRHIEKFNKLTAYLSMKILSLKIVKHSNLSPRDLLKEMEGRISFFEFLIEIGKALCSSKEGIGPDLMGLKNVMTVLESPPVSRLGLQDKISKEHRDIFDELSVLNDEHGKWQREVFKVYEKTILFPGILKNDLMRAEENENMLFMLETKGKLFSNMLSIKSACEESKIIFQTDLEKFLEYFTPPSEEKVYYTSYRVKLRPCDLISLDELSCVYEFLDLLIEEYLNHNFLPRLKVGENIYEPQNIEKALLAYKKLQKEENAKWLGIMEKVKDILRDEYGIVDAYYAGEVYLPLEKMKKGSNKEKLIELANAQKPNSARTANEEKKGSKVGPRISWQGL